MKLVFCLLVLIVLFSCSQENKKKEDSDKITPVDIKKDSVNTLLDTSDKKSPESLELIEKKYGKQWSFCACVKKKDSINKLLSRSLSEKQLDEILDASTTIDKKCKNLFNYDASNPKQRIRHLKKIEDCMSI